MSITTRTIARQEVAELAADLESKGFGCIPNYVSPGDLKRMQEFVSAAMVKSGNEYVHFDGPEAVVGSGLDELAHDPDFRQLIFDLYEEGSGRRAVDQQFYQVLRCLSGRSGQKNSLIFHYDSYVVTALVPIAIPSEGKAGDLLMYPNTRPIRKRYAFNVVDKIFLDNLVTQKMLRGRIDKAVLSPMRIQMKPGNLYFFWGYRSIHTNEPCDPDKLRATALFHYMNPHK